MSNCVVCRHFDLFVRILVCLPEFKILANKPKFWQTNQTSSKQIKLLANKLNLFVRTLVCLPRFFKLLHTYILYWKLKQLNDLLLKSCLNVIQEIPKNSQRNPQKFPKNSRIPKEFPKNSQRISKQFAKNSQYFENTGGPRIIVLLEESC